MSDSDSFWDFYWEMHLNEMEGLGKREAILTVSQLIRRMEGQGRKPLRILEPGCGEGQILGTLATAHAAVCPPQGIVGIDYNARSLATCRRNYPAARWIEGDFTDPALLASFGQFEIVLLVNALHEVFSNGYTPELGEVDVPAALHAARTALADIVDCLVPGGYLALFDGLEPPGDPDERLQVRFQTAQAERLFETFAREYRPFRIRYQPTGRPGCVELSRHDFTRYITKSIFLGKGLWQTEQLESYQYFTEADFRAALAGVGLEIESLRTLTVNEDKWRANVELLTPGASFPAEHIIIVARKPG